MTKLVNKLVPTAVLGAAMLFAACGSSDGSSPGKPAAGSPDNPLVAHTQPETGTSAGANSPGRSNEAAAKPQGSTNTVPGEPSTSKSESGKPKAPGYDTLLENQTKHPSDRFSPCSLVSEVQARAILGAAILQPIEAPQGPTCIYRTQTGKTFISLAVQSAKFSSLKRQLDKREAVTVSDRTAYCGFYGQKMLYAPLNDGRVLSVAAPCGVAKQFAAQAVQSLD